MKKLSILFIILFTLKFSFNAQIKEIVKDQLKIEDDKSNSKEITKISKLFEEKKWKDYNSKIIELKAKINYSFNPIFQYNGCLDDEKFKKYIKTDPNVNFKRNELSKKSEIKDYYREILILSYMDVLKSIEKKDTSLYFENLYKIRNIHFLVILNLHDCTDEPLGNIYNSNNSIGIQKKDCKYSKPFKNLQINELKVFSLLYSVDSLVLDFVKSHKNQDLNIYSDLKSKLNTSKYFKEVDEIIQNIEEEEALSSNDYLLIEKVIQKYPNSVNNSELHNAFDKSFYENTTKAGTIESYEIYLKKFPYGNYSLISKDSIKAINFRIQYKEEKEALLSNSYLQIEKVIQKYPNSENKNELYDAYEKAYYIKIKEKNTIEGFNDYFNKFPKGKYVNEAKENIITINVNNALKSKDVEYIKNVISSFSEHEKIKKVSDYLEQLEYDELQIKGADGYKRFIELYPNSRYTEVAKENLIALTIDKIIQDRDVAALKSFLLSNPNHDRSIEIQEVIQDAEKRALNLKTYEGNYFTGTAKYQYYEKENGERVLHGNFTTIRGEFDGAVSPKMNFLQVINFPRLINPHKIVESDEINSNNFVFFLGGRPTGTFTGKYFHGRKSGQWTIERFFNDNRETLTLNLRNDTLISATYKVINERYKFPFKSCIVCAEMKADITHNGFEGLFYYYSHLDYIKGKYKNGYRDGEWKEFIQYYDPDENEEEMNFVTGGSSFPAEFTTIYSMGKIISQKIVNQQTGEIFILK